MASLVLAIGKPAPSARLHRISQLQIASVQGTGTHLDKTRLLKAVSPKPSMSLCPSLVLASCAKHRLATRPPLNNIVHFPIFCSRCSVHGRPAHRAMQCTWMSITPKYSSHLPCRTCHLVTGPVADILDLPMFSAAAALSVRVCLLPGPACGTVGGPHVLPSPAGCLD